MIEPATFNTLRQFRARVYDRFGPRRDALFELLDAATVAGLVPLLAYLSLPPVHRRRWGSLYDALAAGDIDAPALRELVARYPLDDGQPIFALDTSVWPRDDAETSPARGHYFSSGRQSAGKPIVTGWSYAWLAQLSFTHDGWTAPLDVQRVPAGGSSHAVAAAQIWELLEHLPANGPVPLCVFDAGYDPEAITRELAELDGQRVAVLVRLRSDRCFYADPPPAIGTKVGRPRRHGQKFTCADERTWWTPTSEHREQQYGRVQVRAWAGVHTKTHNHPGKGSYRPKGVVRGTLVLVEVERLPRQTRIPRRLWLWWRGPGQLNLAVVWRAYVHRFDLEHTYRFCKQTLNWTTPRVRTPQQADRWTWLVTLAYTQLRLARRTIEDVHLPWERPQRPDRRLLTPARVRQAFPQLLLTLDTPANLAKTLRTLTWTPKRGPFRPSTPLSGLQKSRLTRPPRSVVTKPAIHPPVGQPVMVKSQAKGWDLGAETLLGDVQDTDRPFAHGRRHVGRRRVLPHDGGEDARWKRCAVEEHRATHDPVFDVLARALELVPENRITEIVRSRGAEVERRPVLKRAHTATAIAAVDIDGTRSWQPSVSSLRSACSPARKWQATSAEWSAHACRSLPRNDSTFPVTAALARPRRAWNDSAARWRTSDGAQPSSRNGATQKHGIYDRRVEDLRMAASKTFVLVHGAWHGGWCWSKVASLLRGRGHRVLTPTQTGLGERSHLLSESIDLETFSADIVNVVKWEDL